VKVKGVMNGTSLRAFTFNVVDLALMRRAVSVPEDRSGFADDPEDGEEVPSEQ
jgi:hypothetical protein